VSLRSYQVDCAHGVWSKAFFLWHVPYPISSRSSRLCWVSFRLCFFCVTKLNCRNEFFLLLGSLSICLP
jgi:hypothetical protein